jgi:ketosteroid isomerase-like protein
MDDNTYLQKAKDPNDLGKFFVIRANAGDVEGLVALYEYDAVLVINNEGKVAKGHEEIRTFYTDLLSKKPIFEKGKQRLALRNGDLALTSSRLVNGIITAEVARLQSDNTWLWIIDQPNI